jgi:hypothetical protein
MRAETRPRWSRPLLHRQIEVTGSNYLVGQFVFGELSLDEVLRSVAQFAQWVMSGLAGL